MSMSLFKDIGTHTVAPMWPFTSEYEVHPRQPLSYFTLFQRFRTSLRPEHWDTRNQDPACHHSNWQAKPPSTNWENWQKTQKLLCHYSNIQILLPCEAFTHRNTFVFPNLLRQMLPTCWWRAGLFSQKTTNKQWERLQFYWKVRTTFECLACPAELFWFHLHSVFFFKPSSMWTWWWCKVLFTLLHV